MSDDLSVIEPDSSELSFGGKPVHIKPLTIGRLPAFTRAVTPIFDPLMVIVAGKGAPPVDALLALISDHGERLIEAVSIATRLPVEELREAAPDEFLTLATAAIRVNVDFFKGRLTPAILAAVKAVAPMPPGVGPTP